MSAEHKSIEHPHHMMQILRIAFVQMLENRAFDPALLMHEISVDNHFHRDIGRCFVIIASNDLPERSFPEYGPDLIAVRDVVSDNRPIMVFFVVVSKVCCCRQ
jgi:hypothetical protein